MSTSAAPVGRFAPSPTGPLHAGSLVPALASYLHVRAQGGRWLLRLDDLDAQRCRGPWRDLILRQLEQLGLRWDGPVLCQSQRTAYYREVLDRLIATGRVYACSCSRAAVQRRGLPLALDGAPLYDGLCRAQIVSTPAQAQGRKLHIRLDGDFRCDDAVCGSFAGVHGRHTGDFAIVERSGRVTYHLATVADDHASAVTQVVRGADLLGCTPRQQALYAALGWPQPLYAHVPLVRATDGTKLSKQTGARALSCLPTDGEIWDALSVLGQQPPVGLRGAPHGQLLDWAIAHWSLVRVPVSPWSHAA